MSRTYELRPVGTVRSPLMTREQCPKQGREGAPDAWLELDPAFSDALDGIDTGCEILVLTWLHQARRDLLKVNPRGDPTRSPRGVFSTRSPDRPNPIGLHRVKVLEVREPGRLKVRPLEVLDATPIIDIKPVLTRSEDG